MNRPTLSVSLVLAAALWGCAASTTALNPNQETSMSSDKKRLVLDAADALFTRGDGSAIDRYFAEPYLQHNPQFPSGLGTLHKLLEMKGLGYQRIRAISDGELVATHSRYTGFGPQPLIAIDLFRVQNGKIVEHWDALQPEAPPNPSGHTMIDGATEITDRAKTDANRALVVDFLQALLVEGKMARLPEFFAGDAYVQHNPQVPDGLSGLGKFMHALAEKGITMRFLKVHRVVAEGNFVLSQSEGEFGGKKTAFYDLFRVENGKIAEHWDVVQEVPEKTASGLGMF